ncbi:hypothetical protein ACS0TY_034977 [Phlomoides rotata]
MLLESIPTMFQSNRTDDSVFGAAVKAAFRAMKNTDGKLLVFQSTKLSFLLLALDPFLLEKLMAEAIVQQEKRRYNDLRWNVTRPQGFEDVMHANGGHENVGPERVNVRVKV